MKRSILFCAIGAFSIALCSCTKEELNPVNSTSNSIGAEKNSSPEKLKSADEQTTLEERLKAAPEYLASRLNMNEIIGSVDWSVIEEQCFDEGCTYVVGTTNGRLRFYPGDISVNPLDFRVTFETYERINASLVKFTMRYIFEDNFASTNYRDIGGNQLEVIPGSTVTNISDNPVASLIETTSRTIDPVVGGTPSTPLELDWWDCTTRCYKTATDACDGDAECKTLCDVADLVGLCTAAIGISCGITCI